MCLGSVVGGLSHCKPGVESSLRSIFSLSDETALTVVRPTGVYLLDFFCSGIQFYVLLKSLSLLYPLFTS